MPRENPAPDAEPPFSPSMVLLLFASRIEREVDSALEEVGLTRRKLGVLGHLTHSPGLSFTELARRAGITVQSMHTLIGSLDEEGLVSSGAGLRGRAATIALTETGRVRLSEGMAAISRIDESAFGPSSSPARMQIREAMFSFAAEMRASG